MIPIFTYHKVSPGDSGGGDFYTVSRGQLVRQLEALAATRRRCVSPSVLLDGSVPTSDGFVLSFDDATEDHYEIVMPLLRERGWSAAFFVPTAKLNKPGYLTDGQLREMARAGQTVGFHSHDHKRLDLVSDDEMREQIGRSRQVVAELTGATPWIFAPPGGFMNEHVREVALGFGVQAIRTMRWGYNERLDLTALETIPLNRHTDDRKFQKVIEARQTRFMYHAKQAMKAFIPARTYERLRSLLFKLSGR